MQTALFICLTMLAFAMNSILNRAAVEGGHADPSSFAIVRVLAGIVVLAMVMTVRGGRLELLRARRWGGGMALALYMIGFSLAYLSLDAGLGALILFGTVQIALFAHAAATGDTPSQRQIIGAAVAFGGLLLAFWPQSDAVGSLSGAVFMVLAGLGWAAYTVAGRRARDPVAVTASHFVLSLPFLAVLLVQPELFVSPTGLGLAILCGGVTSGLGYAMWYRVLPNLPGARAAVVQLSVPVLAIGLGVVLLQEEVGVQILAAAALVLGGIAFALSAQSSPKHRS
jgi:drug/metabolite transporter (DMT)-like permease